MLFFDLTFGFGECILSTMMIQIKAKNKYWSAGKVWKPALFTATKISELDWENYQFIIGDTIFKEPTAEAKAAFDAVIMWEQLQSTK